MLFGDPDEIPDIKRSSGTVRRKRFIYGKLSNGHRNSSGAYRYCTGATGGASGVHREGPPLPEGLMGCKGKGTSPKWAGAPPPKGPCALGFGGTLKGAPPCLGGQAPSPLAAAPL